MSRAVFPLLDFDCQPLTQLFLIFFPPLLLISPFPSPCRIQYADQSVGLAIRNANGATADGQFSVAGPCGGAGMFFFFFFFFFFLRPILRTNPPPPFWFKSATFGANGVSDITAGTAIAGKINYGTGTNGDHASGANVFQVCFSFLVVEGLTTS